MISEEHEECLTEIIYDDTLTPAMKLFRVSNLVSELEEEICSLKEQVEDLSEYKWMYEGLS